MRARILIPKLFVMVSVALTGCAVAPKDSDWRPIEESKRIIQFNAQAFDVAPSVYAGKLSSFNAAAEYGIWRESGGGSRYALIILSRLRPGSNHIFGSSKQRPLATHIETEFEDELVELGELQTIDSNLGEIEFQPFKTETVSCAAIRWYGWKQDEWMGVRGNGVQLGTGALRGFYCEVTDHPMSAERAQEFAGAISLRQNTPW